MAEREPESSPTKATHPPTPTTATTPRFTGHVPVLLTHTIELLSPKQGETFIDCTAGLGGHAAAVAERIGSGGQVVLFDLDSANLEVATTRIRALPAGPTVQAHHASFAEVGRLCGGTGGEAGVGADLVLADLGFASVQVDDASRGFSFMRDGPLDMRLNPTAPITAAEMVASMGERELAELIRDVGEEPHDMARRIASKVVQERKVRPIETTAQLAQIVRSAYPAARAQQSSIHPATKTFQALRIAVNDEIGSLERLLGVIERAAEAAKRGKPTVLAAGARVAIISFHSLEDRPVKQRFAELVERGLAEHLTRKPVIAEESERAVNPRARSAKLRVIRLTGAAEVGERG